MFIRVRTREVRSPLLERKLVIFILVRSPKLPIWILVFNLEKDHRTRACFD